MRTRQVRAVSEIEIFMSQHWSTMVTVYIIGAAVPINSNVKLETAKGFNKSLAGTYKVTGAGALNLRSGAGTGKDKKVLTTMQSGETCQCYGYYTDVSGVKWLYVAYKNVVGFASSKYLKK